MNLEEWQQSRKYVDDIHAHNIKEGNDCGQPDVAGYIYANGSWIANVSNIERTEYFTMVSNEECWSSNLTTVEEFLWFNWCEAECASLSASHEGEVNNEGK